MAEASHRSTWFDQVWLTGMYAADFWIHSMPERLANADARGVHVVMQCAIIWPKRSTSKAQSPGLLQSIFR